MRWLVGNEAGALGLARRHTRIDEGGGCWPLVLAERAHQKGRLAGGWSPLLSDG